MHKRSLLLAAFWLLSSLATAAEPLESLARLVGPAQVLSIPHATTALPAGGHWQGIQPLPVRSDQPRYCILSRDSNDVALLATVALPTANRTQGSIRHVLQLPSDGDEPPLRHAGGIQLAGTTLVVGVEDNQQKRRSQIQFWDMTDPLAPRQRRYLTIRRTGVHAKDKTAGAVGIVRRRSDFLLAVANWDARDLDFYVSNGDPLESATCRFAYQLRWSSRQADRGDWQPNDHWGSYQAIHLLADDEQQTYLVGFHTDDAGRNIADLFALDIGQQPSKIVRKLGSKAMAIPSEIQFRASAGLSVGPKGTWTYYASDFDGRELTRIGVLQ